jgi:hypothetical protein
MVDQLQQQQITTLTNMIVMQEGMTSAVPMQAAR